MLTDGQIARGIFKEQIRKELLDEIGTYEVGLAHNGEILATKTTEWSGHVFVIPYEKYKELFEE